MRRATVTIVIVAALMSCRTAAMADGPQGATMPAPKSLAEKYPGDAGLGKDPAVILHDDFEAAEIDNKKWPEISNKGGGVKLTSARKNVRGGKQALEITATLGKDTGGHLFRRFDKGYEKLHVRFCVKFDKDIDYVHHFVDLCAELPAYKWPTGGAGTQPAGDKKFTVAIEPHGKAGKYRAPGVWSFYCYWWKMPVSGDGKFWGADPGKPAKPYATAKRGRWQTVEIMVKCNTPGKPDGELALWIDGKQLAHHKNVNWRSDGRLKLNAMWLKLYVTDRWAKKKTNRVWFDDVVVATEYIGPPVDKKAAKRRKRPPRQTLRESVKSLGKKIGEREIPGLE